VRAACTRFEALSLARMLSTCALTVLVAMWNASPISVFVAPWARRRRTSRSLRVRPTSPAMTYAPTSSDRRWRVSSRVRYCASVNEWIPLKLKCAEPTIRFAGHEGVAELGDDGPVEDVRRALGDLLEVPAVGDEVREAVLDVLPGHAVGAQDLVGSSGLPSDGDRGQSEGRRRLQVEQYSEHSVLRG
jgi:hypothetical protein